MYDVPEPKNLLKPREGDTIGYCTECGQDIFVGEEIWEIKGECY